jgi:hypothetical protein
MLVHLDASTHQWIAGLPMQDLVVALDDADGRILYARFFSQEGTASTFAALKSVVRNHGRFCELYTDRGSHFCQSGPAAKWPRTTRPGEPSATRTGHPPDPGVHRRLAAAASAPSALSRGGCRRNSGITASPITTPPTATLSSSTSSPTSIAASTVKPAQPESAFVKLAGVELELVLSSKPERIVRNDNTVTFTNLILQLPSTRHRIHFVRCPVTVHQFSNGTLGMSYQGRLLARYDATGGPLHPSPNKERAASAQRLASTAVRRLATHWRTPDPESTFFRPHLTRIQLPYSSGHL